MQHQLKIIYNKSTNKNWTWISPSGHKNEIDYILSKNISNMANVEVWSKFPFNSDHQLVRSTIKFNTKEIRKERFKQKLTKMYEQ